MELDYSYEELLKTLSLSVVSNTRIVKISATSVGLKEAMAISDQMARTSRVELLKAMEAPMPTVAEFAVLPSKRSAPSLSTNVAIGTLGMLLLALVVLRAIYWMDDTIKTSEDLEKVFGIIALSVIPEGKIEGVKKEPERRPPFKVAEGLSRRIQENQTEEGECAMNTQAVIAVNPELPYAMEEALNRMRINVSFSAATFKGS